VAIRASRRHQSPSRRGGTRLARLIRSPGAEQDTPSTAIQLFPDPASDVDTPEERPVRGIVHAMRGFDDV